MGALLLVLLAADPKPIAVWDLDDETGLTLVQEAWFSEGAVGRSLELDGRAGYATARDSADLQPAQVTVAAWFKLKKLPVEHGVTIVCKPQKAAPWSHPFLSWMIRINTATQIEAAVGAGGSYGGSFVPRAPLEAGRWYHVALSYDGIALRGYLDGAPLGSLTPVKGPIDYGPYPVLIGADHGAVPVADHFPGLIDQVMVWGTALDPTAIRRVFLSRRAAASAPSPGRTNRESPR